MTIVRRSFQRMAMIMAGYVVITEYVFWRQPQRHELGLALMCGLMVMLIWAMLAGILNSNRRRY